MGRRKVYAIQHNKTKRIYIGSSERPQERYLSHIYALRRGAHSVEDMQKDYDDFGENYSLYILDDGDELERYREYKWMRKYNTTQRGIGYNYKDNEKAYSKAVMPIPVSDGLPIGFSEMKEFSETKSYYISKITSMVSKCDDISLLDLVCKTLEKSMNQDESKC